MAAKISNGLLCFVKNPNRIHQTLSLKANANDYSIVSAVIDYEDEGIFWHLRVTIPLETDGCKRGHPLIRPDLRHAGWRNEVESF